MHNYAKQANLSDRMNAKKVGNEYRIFYSDAYLSGLSKYFSHKEANQRYTNFLSKKNFTLKNTEHSYRAINYWCSLGLIDDDRNNGSREWRKFSVVDMAWLGILNQLQEIGFSLNKIKSCYDTLTKPLNELEYGISLCMLHKAVYLVVFLDGKAELATRDSLAISENFCRLDKQTFVVITLNNSLNKIFPNNDWGPMLDTFQLSGNELSILYALRNANYDEIVIHKKDGCIDRINTSTKYFGEFENLPDILKRASFGEFKIKKENGKIYFIESIENMNF